jgi:hypothetical protein
MKRGTKERIMRNKGRKTEKDKRKKENEKEKYLV